MNSHSPTPSSGGGLPTHNTAKRSARMAYMSDSQAEAYLLARDTVRRVQRISSLIGAIPDRKAFTLNRAQGGQLPGH